MFDIGFGELIIIAIIGIVVVGPNKLPEVMRSIMVMTRKIQHAFSDAKQNIEQELDINGIKQIIHDSEIDAHIRELNQSIMDLNDEVYEEERKLRRNITRNVPLQKVLSNDIPPNPALRDDPSFKDSANSGISNDIARARKNTAQLSKSPSEDIPYLRDTPL